MGRDFSPVETIETQIYGLDFVNDLDANETLIGAVWSLTVIQGVDPLASTRLSGLPALVTPTGTTRQTATQQRISGLLANVTYTAQAIVTTSLSNTKSLWTHIRGEPVE